MINKTILKLSEIEDNNWGAEYYHPDKLKAIKILSKSNDRISSFFSPIKKTYHVKEGNKNIINLEGVSQGFIQNSTSEKSKSNKKRVKEGDIIISKLRPYLKEISLVSKKFDDFYVSTELIILREKVKKDGFRFILLPFLFTKEVQKILFWSQQGTNHPRFNEKVLLDINFPKFKESFIKNIENNILESYRCYNRGIELYLEAEKKLLSYFNLDSIEKETKKFSIRSFSETLLNNRFDADFYQEKYDKMMDLMMKKSKTDKLGELVKIKKGIEVGADEYLDEGIPFIRVSNVSKFEVTPNDQKFISKETYERYKDNFKPKKNEVLLTKDGSLGISLLINQDKESLISGGILRLNVDSPLITKEYLSLILNSKLVHFQIEKYSGGAIIVHWRPELIKETIIPIINEKKMQELTELIKESYSLIEKSKFIFKRAIEEIESEIIK